MDDLARMMWESAHSGISARGRAIQTCCGIERCGLSSIPKDKPSPTLQAPNGPVAALAAKLATIRKSSKTDGVRHALESELPRIESAKPLAERLRALQDRVAGRQATGFAADRAFCDGLSGDLRSTPPQLPQS